MANKIDEWNGNNIFEHDYDQWKGHEDCNSLVGYGVAYKFHRWLRDNDIVDEYTSVDDTYGNMSGSRDGNRYDIHDNYELFEWKNGEYISSGMEISFLYVVNGNLWATLEKEGDWYGDIEIPNV